MLDLARIVLLIIGVFTLVCAMIFRSEKRSRAFLIRYMRFYGVDAAKIPSSPAIPDPLKPFFIQARIASYLFMGLGVVICGAAVFLIFYV